MDPGLRLGHFSKLNSYIRSKGRMAFIKDQLKAALNYHTVITIGLYLSKRICTRVVSSREVGRDTVQAVLACKIQTEPLGQGGRRIKA